MAILKVELDAEARAALERMRDRAAKPYLRVRAAAILKVADGQTAKQVAATGLLKPMDEETVQGFVHRYQQSGIEGLHILAGRGRKPAFPPGALPKSAGGG